MKRLVVLFVLAAALAAANLGVVSAASATVLCKTATRPCTGGTYGKGTLLEASLKAGTKLTFDAGYKTFECTEASLKGEVVSPGSNGASVTGTVSTLGFGKCGSVMTLVKGSFAIKYSSGTSGTLTLEGFQILAGECIYQGPASIPLSGGSMASIGSTTSMPLKEGGAECAASGTMSAEYTVTVPEPLFVSVEPATVLCKVAKNPCPAESAYGAGQSIALQLATATQSTFGNPAPFVACNKATVEGEITTKPGTGFDASGPVKTLSFGECTSAVEVFKKGTFSIDYTSGSNGTLRLEGFQISDGLTLCLLEGPALLALTGGAMATAGINSTVPNGCAGTTRTWTASFKIAKPEPLYVSEL